MCDVENLCPKQQASARGGGQVRSTRLGTAGSELGEYRITASKQSPDRVAVEMWGFSSRGVKTSRYELLVEWV